MSPSSIRLGRRPLTSLRGVQIPLVTPANARRPHRNDVAFFASRHTAKGPRRTGGCIYGITRRREQMSFEIGENSGKRNFSEKKFFPRQNCEARPSLPFQRYLYFRIPGPLSFPVIGFGKDSLRRGTALTPNKKRPRNLSDAGPLL